MRRSLAPSQLGGTPAAKRLRIGRFNIGSYMTQLKNYFCYVDNVGGTSLIGGLTNASCFDPSKKVNTQRSSQDVLELLENNPKSMGPMKNNEHPLLIEKNVMKPADNVKYVSQKMTNVTVQCASVLVNELYFCV